MEARRYLRSAWDPRIRTAIVELELTEELITVLTAVLHNLFAAS
jgi:hypothetical protein